jgi:hypothetical protein
MSLVAQVKALREFFGLVPGNLVKDLKEMKELLELTDQGSVQADVNKLLMATGLACNEGTRRVCACVCAPAAPAVSSQQSATTATAVRELLLACVCHVGEGCMHETHPAWQKSRRVRPRRAHARRHHHHAATQK